MNDKVNVQKGLLIKSSNLNHQWGASCSSSLNFGIRFTTLET
jgi:hypothetical protein